MPKRVFLWIISLAFVMVACAPRMKGEDPATVKAPKETSQPVAQSTGQAGCTVRTRQATPNPTLEAMLPAVTEKDWVRGNDDAFVTIIDYSDFQ